MQAGGGTPVGAGMAANRLIAEGATALVSFGLAGGLDPALRPGTIVVPTFVLSDRERLATDAGLAAWFGGLTDHVLLAGYGVVSDVAAKRGLFEQSGAHAVDLESGPVGRIAGTYGVPFVVVRAICDPAERALPPAALVAVDSDGGIGFGGVLRSILRQPGQIAALLALARDASHARQALIGATVRFRAPPPAL